jgi:hypothetical protein
MRRFAMPPEELEPRRIDCAAIARAGLWSQERCCEACHRGICADPLALEQNLGPGGEAGRVRMLLCCVASAEVDLVKAARLL